MAKRSTTPAKPAPQPRPVIIPCALTGSTDDGPRYPYPDLGPVCEAALVTLGVPGHYRLEEAKELQEYIDDIKARLAAASKK